MQNAIAVAVVAASAVAAYPAVKIAALLVDLKQLWAHGRDNRIAVGHKLRLLQDELAKPGYGKFVHVVTKELGIPASTAYTYMREAKVAAGVAAPKRLSQNRKDAAPGNCVQLQAAMMSAVKNHVRGVFDPLRNDPDALCANLQTLLQQTADDLLNKAGIGLCVVVAVQK